MNMKKIFKYILLSALTITAVASCEDDRNNFLPEDSFGFNNKANENVITLPLYGGTYRLDVIKSGKGFNEGSVTIASIDTLLNAFNAANETAYVALPADKELYSFSAQTISFKAEDVTLPLEITWDVAKVSEFMSQNADKEFCIPVSLVSDNLEVNEGRDFFVLHLSKSTLTAKQKELASTVIWETEPSKKELRVNTELDMAIDAFDFTIEFVQDNELVAAYNEANGTAYEVAPEGLVTLGENPVMKAGEVEAIFTMDLNTAALVDPATGKIKRDWEGYVAPVKIKSLSEPGINVNNDVTYVVVKGMIPPAAQLFERVWGHYSDGALALPWYMNGGLSIDGLTNATFGGNDRSFTMNDEYIFIASACATPGVHKFDLLTGKYVGTLDVTGMAESGATYPTSVPRVVPNSDPTINGGEDILVVGGLAVEGANLTLYAYLNGIDAAPESLYSLAAARRFGDKMSFAGTWQDGKFWLRSNQSGTNLVAYIPVGKGSDNGSVQKWIVGYAMTCEDNNVMSDVYWTPQTDGTIQDYCLIGTNSDQGLHLITGTSAGAGAGAVVQSYTDLACTFGWNFFEHNGTKLMAFVSVKDKLRPMVYVIKGDYTTVDGLKAALDAFGEENIVFSAPLQDALDATLSGYESGMTLGDCCVRKIGDDIYMLAGGHSVGISLFKLDKNFVVK